MSKDSLITKPLTQQNETLNNLIVPAKIPSCKIDSAVPVKNITELHECLRLVHDQYVSRGLMKPHDSGIRVTKSIFYPSTTTFCYKNNGQIEGTMSYILESEKLKIPSRSQFQKELAEHIPNYSLVAETSLFATKEDKDRQNICGKALFELTRTVYYFGRHHSNYLVAVVNPIHADVYSRLFNFKPISDPKSYKLALDNPGQLMIHDYFLTTLNIDSQHNLFIREFSDKKTSVDQCQNRLELKPEDAAGLLIAYPEVIDTMSASEQSYIDEIYNNQLGPIFKELANR